MKKGIHPENYRPVVFKDMSNEDIFITRSTMPAKETIVVDGVEYPLIKVEISSTSHPFFTGKAKLVDTAGRVDKFMSRYGSRKKKDIPYPTIGTGHRDPERSTSSGSSFFPPPPRGHYRREEPP